MKCIQNLFQKQAIFIVFIFAAVIFYPGCKKTDVQASEPSSPENFTHHFFDGVGNQKNQLTRIAEELKKQDKGTSLISTFIKKFGYPKWENSIVSIAGNNKGAVNKTNGVSDTIVIIPIVERGSKIVKSYIEAHVNDSIVLNLITSNRYSKLPFSNMQTAINQAEKHAVRFMLLNKELFGYNNFLITDKRLFAGGNGKADNVKRTLSFTGNAVKVLAGKMALEEICVYVTTSSTSWYCGTPGYSGCIPTCDHCGSFCHEVTSSNTTSYCESWWVDDGSGSGGGTIGGDGSTGGGGGVDSDPDPEDPCGALVPRIINARLPCEGDGSDGWEPSGVPTYETNYQLTPRDRATWDKIYADEKEADEVANKDCQGTGMLGGNMNFPGTVEHWLIQIDYLSRNPFYGEREYQVPYSSATGNRGYADMVNRFSRQMFEIKPNDPAQIANGATELGRYIVNANIYCSGNPLPGGAVTWGAGNNYETRYLNYPADPTKLLEATLVQPGMIGYKVVTKDGTQVPAPVVIPQTVLDKIKQLVNRLRNNVGQFEIIVAEYMAQNPELVQYLKSAALTAAAAIIVGTILEDIATAGVGIADDWASFLLAYRIARFAWAL